MKNLYIFRHGQSEWNIQNRLQGQTSNPKIYLTKQGLADAKTIAPKLKDKNIEIIISSDLTRAKQTGEQVAKDLNLPIEFSPKLQETNLGEAQGLTIPECDKKFPEMKTDYEFLTNHYDTPLANTGETINQIINRIKNFLLAICNSKQESNIAISSHGGVIACFLSSLNGGEYLKLDNADIVHVTYNENTNEFIYNGFIK